MSDITYYVSLVLKKIERFLRYHHFVFFSVLTVIGLLIALWFMYTDVSHVTDSTTPQTQSTSTSFDKTTIDNLKRLQRSSENTKPLAKPDGRTNPFTEDQ